MRKSYPKSPTTTKYQQTIIGKQNSDTVMFIEKQENYALINLAVGKKKNKKAK